MQTYDAGGKRGMAEDWVIDPLKPERLMCYRDELNSHISREAQRLQPSIRLQLDTQVTHANLDQQQLTFSQGGKPSEVGSLGRPSTARQPVEHYLACDSLMPV